MKMKKLKSISNNLIFDMKESSATKDYTNTQSNEVILWVSMQVKE